MIILCGGRTGTSGETCPALATLSSTTSNGRPCSPRRASRSSQAARQPSGVSGRPSPVSPRARSRRAAVDPKSTGSSALNPRMFSSSTPPGNHPRSWAIRAACMARAVFPTPAIPSTADTTVTPACSPPGLSRSSNSSSNAARPVNISGSAGRVTGPGLLSSPPLASEPKTFCTRSSPASMSAYFCFSERGARSTLASMSARLRPERQALQGHGHGLSD